MHTGISLLCFYVLIQVLASSANGQSEATDWSVRSLQHSRRRHRETPAAAVGGDSDGRSTRSSRRAGRRGRSGGRRRDAQTTEPPETTEEPLFLNFHNGPDASAMMPPVCGRDCLYTRDLRRHHRLEAIKEDILRKLKLDGPVNITNRPLELPGVPAIQEILHESQIQSDQPFGHHHQSMLYDDDVDDETDSATTLRVFNFAEAPPANMSTNDSQVCIFKFSNHILGSRSPVQNATLGVYIKSPAVPDVMYTYILIYVLGPAHHNNRPRQHLLHKRKINLDIEQTRRWYEFDLTRQVNNWIKWPDTNRGIKIIAADSQGVPLAIVTPQAPAEEPYKPYLELRMRDKGRSRSKRRLRLDCDEHSNETRCCRYPLEIDFNSFQWDFIIAPKRYSAYYCAGECPFVYFQKYPHTHVFENAKPKDAGGPCCSPEKLSPLRMLYFDENLQIKIDTLPGMVVDRCGCAS